MTSTSISTQAIDIPALPGTAMSLTPEIESKAVTYDSADTEKKKAIEAIMQDINLKDRGSILYFGSKAQEEMTSVSETMLEGVRNKDLGVAGEALGSMIQNIREFDVDELNPNRKQGFFEKLFNNNPLTDFMDRYTDVRKQITTITDRLEEHKTQLLTDIVTLDKLYDANLDYFKQLELYIAAGDERLRLLDTKDIPELAGKAEADLENMLIAQEVRDLRSARDDLERRVHDLKLTRQVAMQSLPSIRLVQENDKSLVNKINSTIVNTVPLWKNQLAQAVTMFRMGNAAKTVKDATDLTNDLLEANANTLREGNQEVRRQMERGVFDIESVKLANQSLIDTINDSLRITDEGKAARANAEKELQNMESELRKVLIAAKSQASR